MAAESEQHTETERDRGKCACTPWPTDKDPYKFPDETESIRRLLKVLEEVVRKTESETKQTDATKKFAEDIAACDKEYQALGALVDKYADFYSKLDCSLADTKKQRDEIKVWYEGKIEKDTKDKIFRVREDNYEAEEKKKCCHWLKVRDAHTHLYECLRQSEKTEEEAKDDFEAIKSLEKTVKDRLADLKTVYDKAKTLKDARRFNSVYAASLEFDAVYSKLGRLDTWCCQYKDCEKHNAAQSQGQGRNCYCKEGTDLKKDWETSVYKQELLRALRALIAAKYQRFRWHQQWITSEENSKSAKDACEKFRKTRREEFIQEAEDIPDKKDGGDSSTASSAS